MTALVNLFKTEPTVVIGALGTLVTAVIALGVAFGVHVTDDQRNAILGFIGALGLIVTLLAQRSQVTPTAGLPPPPPPAG